MKISEMATDKAADVLIVISEPAARIMEDGKAADIIKQFAGKRGDESVINLVGAFVSTVVPYLLKDHRNDVYAVLSALTDKTINEIAKQNIMLTMQDIKDSVDKDLLTFFQSQVS